MNVNSHISANRGGDIIETEHSDSSKLQIKILVYTCMNCFAMLKGKPALLPFQSNLLQANTSTDIIPQYRKFMQDI